MKKTLLLVLGLAVVYVILSGTTASAQLWDKKTIITINQPMEIPGKPAIVLPPGKYVLKLLNTPGTRSIVQFFDADETKLYSTVIGIPDYRLQTPEKAEISFYEPEPGRALPIRAWFFPGDNYGVEFVYSKERALEVAKASQQHVMSAANPTTSNPSEQPTNRQIAELQNETVVAATPQGTEISLAEAHPAEVKAPVSPSTVNPPATSASTAPVAIVASNTLPNTASPLPLLALTGVLLLGAGFSLRVLLR